MEEKRTKPLILVRLKKLEPAAQLGKGDGEAFAELLHGGKPDEILRQDAEDEEEAIAGIRDDEVWKDGMGMAAGADEAQDAEVMADRDTAYEVNKGTSIVGMDLAGALHPTAGAGLKQGLESSHEGIEEIF